MGSIATQNPNLIIFALSCNISSARQIIGCVLYISDHYSNIHDMYRSEGGEIGLQTQGGKSIGMHSFPA